MRNPASFRRAAGATCLILAAPLMAAAMGTDVPFSGEPTEVLRAMQEAGGRAWLSAITYALGQLALLIGLLGVAHLLRDRAPVLSNLGGGLSVLGAFGHTVHAGGVLVIVSIAQGEVGQDAAAIALKDYQASPAMLFSAIGFFGYVIGLILLTIGVWHAGVGPRWVPAALAGFVAIEFAGTAISPWATYVAGTLYIASLTALAITIWRSPQSQWQTADGATANVATGAEITAPR